MRFDPGDVSKAYFQDPADNTWHELAWEQADAAVGPFLAEGDMPVTGVVSSLGISTDHMRQILHHHPLPMPPRPIRRRKPAATSDRQQPAQPPRNQR